MIGNPLPALLALLAGATLLRPATTADQQPTVTVHPHATNQLEIIATGLENEIPYLVMARTNGPTGSWFQLTGIFGTTNHSATVLLSLSEAKKSEGLRGLALHNLSTWTFVVGCALDTDGDELPDVYEDLASRTDPYTPDDPYADPDGDGWSNLQEWQNNTDPLRFDSPPPPQNLQVAFNPDTGIAKLTWSYWTGQPDYFTIEKQERTLHPGTNVGPFILQPPSGTNRTNWDAYLARQREIQRRYGRPYSQQHDAYYVNGPVRVLARVPAHPGQQDYSFTESNLVHSITSNPEYRIQAHIAPPLRAELARINATTIRQTLLPVTTQPTPDGYDLTAPHPIPYAWYLLLVRDRNNPQWRASGYFTSGTNRDPVHLHVDRMGMMSAGQNPISMPAVRFLPPVVAPEFTAGWGEDSDGDGLPDIYEVIVTGTDPANPDTGGLGVLDGYKDPDHDGWSNLEEFRRRTNPLKPNPIPPPITLHHPTARQLLEAVQPRTDLRYEPQLTARKDGTTQYQPIDQAFKEIPPAAFLRGATTNLAADVRIEWQIPRPHPPPSGYSGP